MLPGHTSSSKQIHTVESRLRTESKVAVKEGWSLVRDFVHFDSDLQHTQRILSVQVSTASFGSVHGNNMFTLRLMCVCVYLLNRF